MIALWLALARAGTADGAAERFLSCLDALERGEPWVRNASGCAAWAEDPTGASTSTWSLDAARTKLAAVREPVTELVGRIVEDCPGIVARRRFPMMDLQLCALIAGARSVAIYDERDLVTGATLPVDLAVLRHTSHTPRRLGPDPLVIEHTDLSGMVRYQVRLSGPGDVCLTHRDRYLARIDEVALVQDGDVRQWTLDLAFYECLPSREANVEKGQDSCACPPAGNP